MQLTQNTLHMPDKTTGITHISYIYPEILLYKHNTLQNTCKISTITT